jgi:hypothetical protein
MWPIIHPDFPLIVSTIVDNLHGTIPHMNMDPNRKLEDEFPIEMGVPYRGSILIYWIPSHDIQINGPENKNGSSQIPQMLGFTVDLPLGNPFRKVTDSTNPGSQTVC